MKEAQNQLGFSAKMMRKNSERPAGLHFHRKPYKNIISVDTTEKIKIFLERDNNSRATTGKRETLTRQKVKKQKRVLNDTLHNLYLKFKMESPLLKLSYTEFCKNRPFWVVTPTSRDRDACLCKIHANVQFMADKLAYHRVIQSKNPNRLMEALCCEKPTKECAYRECNLCKGIELQTGEFDPGLQTYWFN